MEIYSYSVVLIGYLLGSISWSYIIGRLVSNIDISQEGDGKISAAALYKRVGLWPTLLAGFLDFCMGALAIIIARALSESQAVILITGLAAMAGHNWSIFLKFRGGLGASIIQGVLAALVLLPFVIGGLVALISRRIIPRNDVSTVIWVATVAFVLLIQNLFFNQNHSPILIVYPFALLLPMFLKRLQTSSTIFGYTVKHR